MKKGLIVVAVLLVAGGLVGYFNFPKKKPNTDPRCGQGIGPSSPGPCTLNLVFSYVYNSNKGECEMVSHGACQSAPNFGTLLECNQVCVAKWRPVSIKDKLVTFGKVVVGDEEPFVHLDKEGKFSYKGGRSFFLIDAGELSDGRIVGLFGADDGGTYSRVFRKTSASEYLSINANRFSEDRVRVGAKFELQGEVLVIKYFMFSCGGYQPPCGTEFEKKFKIEGDRLGEVKG